jgi:UDP-N-acetyl-D-glucosamine dehydrogenase
LREEGAIVTVHDPMYGDDELRELGFVPHQLGSSADIAILQSDHDDYRRIGRKDLPGVRVVVDGRNHLDPDAFTPATVVTVGRAGGRVDTTEGIPPWT